MTSAIFKNREDAAFALAKKLQAYQNKNCVVLAIPRGGVPLGKIIADELHCPLDLLFVKKIGHPFHKEYAVGAVSLYGVSVNPDAVDVDPAYIKTEAELLINNLKEKKKNLCGNKPAVPIKGKTVIVVDDGIATGQTLLAAIPQIRRADAERIIVAVPVAPADISERFGKLTDEFICLHTDSNFSSIGAFYDDFSQVNDEEVKALLR